MNLIILLKLRDQNNSVVFMVICKLYANLIGLIRMWNDFESAIQSNRTHKLQLNKMRHINVLRFNETVISGFILQLYITFGVNQYANKCDI